jgi:multidrug resistance efflux pump
MSAAPKTDPKVLSLRLPDLDDTGQPGGRFVRSAVSLTLGVIAALAVVAVAVSLLVKMDVTVKSAGVLEPVRVYPVRTMVAGSVAQVLVRSGDTVEAGQVLIRLDALAMEAQLAQLEAQYRAAASDRERALASAPLERRQQAERLQAAQARLTSARALLLQRMVEHGFGSSVDSLLNAYRPGSHVALDQAVGEVRSAQTDIRLNATDTDMLALRSYDERRTAAEMDRLDSQVRETRERLARTEITAPGSGVVLTEQIERLPGAFVREGETLLEVAERSDWRVTMAVPERDVNRIRPGDPVRFEIRAFSQRDRRQLQGRVVHVAAEPGSEEAGVAAGPRTPAGMYRVVAELEPGELDMDAVERLRRGYTVEANVITRSGRIAELGWYYLMERLNRR